MKAVCCSIITVFILGLNLSAQEGRMTYNPVKDGNEILPVEVRYRYPQFIQGQVYFKNGNGGSGKLNFNLLVNEIQFINDNGDTLALDLIETMKFLTIGEDTFYFNKGIVESIGRYDDVQLAVKERLVLKDVQKIGAYGMTNPGGAVDSYNSIRVSQGTYKLGMNQNLVFGKDRDYLLIVKDKLFLPLNRNSIEKAFPAKRNKVENFITENKINLRKEEDIRKLLAFCSER
jgi:hypothetical protein